MGAGGNSKMVYSRKRVQIIWAAVVALLTAGVCHAADAKIPQRVISLSPIITETIYLLGAQDRLVGNTTYCNMPEAAKHKEKIGSVIQMNVEKIIRLKPDLVIASALTREKQLKMLEKFSIPIVRAQNPKTFDQMCSMTLELGRTLGCIDRARAITSAADAQVQHTLDRTRNLPKPKVFIQIGIKPLHSVNRDMFINEFIRCSGGVNIAENERSGVYSREKVLSINPDIILIATMGSSKKAGFEEQKKWMQHHTMKAVKNNQIHVLDPEWICSPTPTTFVRGLKEILPLIHPELADSGLVSNVSESEQN